MAQVFPGGEPSARGPPALEVVYNAGDLGQSERCMLKPEDNSVGVASIPAPFFQIRKVRLG